MQVNDVIQRYYKLKQSINIANESISRYDNLMSEIKINLADLDTKLKLNAGCIEFHNKAIDLKYQKSVQEVKDVLNDGLEYVFGKRYMIDLVMSDKRGKSLSLEIYEYDNRERVSSLDRGMSMAVCCLISAVLQIYYCHAKGCNFIGLDEQWHNVCVEYISEFYDFISKLCKNLGITLVLISHDARIEPFVDKRFRVDLGECSVV